MPVAARKLLVSVGLEGDQLVIKKIREIDNAFDRAGGSGSGVSKFSKARAVMQGFIGPAAEVVSAVRDIGEVAIGAAEFVFGLAKSAADAGSEIQDLSEQTGLGAETISSLRSACVTTKVSVDDMAAGINKFSKTIGDAARGSQEAKDKLVRLGIDPQEAVNDLEGALDKAFKTIYNAPGIKQTNAAIDAFSKGGAKLQSVVIAAGGSVEELKKQSKLLGTQISTEDARRADEFGDALATLELQAQTTTFEFARHFMPEVTGAMKDVSREMLANKNMATEWGKAFADSIRGVRLIVQEDGAELVGWLKTTLTLLGAYSSIAEYIGYQIGTAIREKGAASRANDPSSDPNDPSNRSKAGSQAAGAYADWKRRQMELSGYDMGKTGGAGSSGSSADTKFQNAIKAARSNAEGVLDYIQNQTTALAREYRLQITSIDEFVSRSKALADKKLQTVYAETNAERAALSLSKKTATERAQISEELDQKDIKAKREYVETIRSIDDQAAEDRLNQLRDNFRDEEAVRDEYDRARIARDRHSADAHASAFAKASRIMSDNDAAAYEYRRTVENITYQEAEKAAARVEQNAFNRQRAQLNKELALAKEDVGERRRIQAELHLLDQKERTFREESRRRAQDAYEKDIALQNDVLENAADHARKIMALDVAVANSGMESERLRLEAALAATNQFGKARQTAVAKLAILDVKEITQKHQRNQDGLDLDEAALLQEATIESERLEIKRKYKPDSREEEDKRYNDELKKRVEEGNREVTMAGNAGAFGFGMQSGQLATLQNGVQSFADVATVAFSAVGVAANGLAQGIGAMVSNWVLMGDLGPDAMRKMTAATLANIAQQAAVQGVWFTAWGIADLFWNPARAGSDFAAAALFFSIAGAAAIGGRALAGNKFNGKGNSGSAGAAPDYSQFGQQGYSGNQSIRTGGSATGRGQDAHTAALARAVEKLTARLDTNDRLADKIDSMRSGDVLVKGIEQKRGLIGTTVEKELSNQTLATNVGRKLGFAR